MVQLKCEAERGDIYMCVCMWTAFFAQKQNTHDRQHCAENGTECD